jgi:phenylpropionate dioxygenase-like ring-hydroxylating dioxygenase large terminal subunit
MIDINKTYRTRDGHEVRIYATDGLAPYSVHGAIKIPPGWHDRAWTREGKAEDHALYNCDLIEVKLRHKRTIWINVYPNGQNATWGEKRLADRNRGLSAIACVKVELDFEEGEGI